MDTYEATKIVFSRIQSLDPDNASKAMGYILWQDQGEKEMIRLAFGPETLLLSVINQAKTHMGLPTPNSTTPTTPSSPSPFSPLSNQARPSHLHQSSSPRVIIPNNGYHVNPSSPSSPWSVSGFSDHRSPSSHLSPRPGSSLSYAAVVNGSSGAGGSGSFSPPVAAASFPPSYYNSSSGEPNGDLNSQVQEQLSFLDDSSSGNVDFSDPIMIPSGRRDSVPFPFGNCGDSHHHHLHRRSCSVSDDFLGGGGGGGGVSEDGGGAGFGWRPCMYFARGFCKNGSTCKFMHGGSGFADSPDGSDVGSPGKLDGFDEFLRMKAIQQQRFAAASQLMAGGGHFPYNKGMMSFMNDSPRSAAAAALILGDDLYKFGRFRSERSDLFALSSANSSSRQIYLTFPADSTFKEEDVSAYFSKYGPVQDVRIPYQQKRMFGFVTFVYSDTVKMILAKGNPHFVCDSRVLVKPYKEKGKIPDKKQHPLDRGEYLSGFESYDLPIGPRMICDPQDILLRRKLEEQAELQQAIELHGRRLRTLQLMDLQNHHHGHGHGHPSLIHPNFTAGLPSPPSILQTHPHMNQFQYDDDAANEDISEGDNNNLTKEKLTNYDEAESLEHILPDNLFASPTKKAAVGNSSLFSVAGEKEGDDEDGGGSSSSVLKNTNKSILPSSALNMASSIKSCYFQMPRISSGQEAIEM